MAMINGTEGNDQGLGTLNGTPNSDIINGFGGDDSISAFAGDDVISVRAAGGYGDTVHGGEGSDTLAVQFDVAGAVNFDSWGPSGHLRFITASTSLADALVALSGTSFKLGMGNYAYAGVGFDGIENLSLQAFNGAQDDLLVVFGQGTYDGGPGSDTLVADWSALGVSTIWDNLAGAEQQVNGSRISNVERLVLSTGSDSDDVRNTATNSNDDIQTGAGDDTLHSGGGSDRVDLGAGDDLARVVSAAGYGDTVLGGDGNDILIVDARTSGESGIYWSGSNAAGQSVGGTVNAGSSLASVAFLVTSAYWYDLNTGNGIPGVVFNSIENLGILASEAANYDDLLIVRGAGTYDGAGGTDSLYADWSAVAADIAWNNKASAVAQSVNGSTLSNVERLLVRSGSGNDELSNTVAATSDEFETGAGNDTIHAGSGLDRVDAGSGDDLVTVLVNTGSNLKDTVVGGNGVDTLVADASAGTGRLDWETYDINGTYLGMALYNSSLAAMGVVFSPATRWLVTGLTFDGIENFSLLASAAGILDDVLPVIGAGTYDGGGGTDTLYADWSVAAGAIIWNNLASAAAQSVNGSSISNVERLLLRTGGGADDIRNTVAATNDEFETGAGHDIVYAGGGADRVTPGAGNDTVDGGAGSDTVVFAGNRAQYTLTRNASGTVVNVSSSAEGADRLIAVETLQFADGAVGTSSTGTVDNSAPTLAGATPPAGSTGASTEGAIVLTFSEAVEAGSGSAWLKSSDGTVIEQFDMTTATHLQISGNTLTVSPAADLLSMTGYRLELDAGSLKDAVGNALAALSSYSFTTGPASYTGGSGNDSLVGDSWGNRFLPGAGNDTLNGGAGTDTAVFSGALSDHLIRYNRGLGQASVTDQRADGDGVDTLSSIEKLQFGSQVFDLLNPPRTAPPVFATSRSFLFDAAFYLLDNPELVPTVTLATAFDHYNSTGAAQGKAPTAWFEPDYYANRWPDLTPLNLDAATLFAHYNLYGVWEGRSAGRVFDLYDGNRYLTENPDVAAYVDAYVADFLGSRSNGAIAHYVIYGAAEGRIAYDFNGQPLDMAIVVGGGG